MNVEHPRIAVIGAGASGLAAIKCCLDENLDVTCFEKSNGIGGLWRYSERATSGRAGVYRTTVINSSKELLAYSTFPPPREFPNFMHHTKLLEYLSLYADNYDLKKHIRFNTEVIAVAKSADFDETGNWVAAYKSAEMEEFVTEKFGAVMVCTGHHVYPNDPSKNIPGRLEFKGRIFHGHDYRDHKTFIDRRVMVVGMGNTGGDVAAELSRHAAKVLLSTRRGAWVINRIAYGGKPYDCALVTRFLHYILKVTPFSIANGAFEFLMNTRFDHRLYGIKPKHRIMSQHPLVNDELPTRIANGSLLIVPNIKSFRENGVVTSDDVFHEIDDVIFATGYKIKFPFLSDTVVSVNDQNRLSMLYKHVFPLSLSENPTLALIGNVQPLGGLMPIAEMQSRWAVRVFKKIVYLPPHSVMGNEVISRNLQLEERYVHSSRHTIQVDYMDYMDSIAGEIGAKPNVFRMFFTDPLLAWLVLTGPGSSYQYRLNGPLKWSGARRAIATLQSRVAAGFGKGACIQSRVCLERLEDMTLLPSPSFILCICLCISFLLIICWFLLTNLCQLQNDD